MMQSNTPRPDDVSASGAGADDLLSRLSAADQRIRDLEAEKISATQAMRRIVNAFRLRLPSDAPFAELVGGLGAIAEDKESDDIIATERYLNEGGDLPVEGNHEEKPYNQAQ
jgi:hypothetical protein